MDLRAHALALLRRLAGDDAATFHEGQWEAIETLVTHRRRALVVQRTGWGKSAVYFIATRLRRAEGSGATFKQWGGACGGTVTTCGIALIVLISGSASRSSRTDSTVRCAFMPTSFCFMS